MIRWSNGLIYQYGAASGTFGKDGGGWEHQKLLRKFGILDLNRLGIIPEAKTFTLEPTVGNWTGKFSDCIEFIGHPRLQGIPVLKQIPYGSRNAIGMSNDGANIEIERIRRFIQQTGIRPIVSITGSTEELVAMALMVNKIPAAAMIINGSCPNLCSSIPDEERIGEGCWAIKRVSRHPVLVKVSVNHDPEKIASEVDGAVESILVNAPAHNLLYETPSRFAPHKSKVGGGISGGPAQALTFPYVKKLAEVSTTPVVGCSVVYYGDMAKLYGLGAKAINFGFLALTYPWLIPPYIYWDRRRLLKLRQ